MGRETIRPLAACNHERQVNPVGARVQFPPAALSGLGEARKSG